MANNKNFTKTMVGTGFEALTTLHIGAEVEIFFQNSEDSTGTAIIKDSTGQIVFKLQPGVRDRFPVDRTRVPDLAAASLAAGRRGDVEDLSEWTVSTGVADDVIYVNAR